MFSANTIRILVAGSLLLHAIAHAIALGALVSQSLGGAIASRLVVRSWLFPALRPITAASFAIPFWLISTLGFLAASLSFWGALLPGATWRWVVVGAALLSILGIALFSGTWPGSPNLQRSILNTLVALAVNGAILVSQFWLSWPPLGMFGK